MAALEAHNNLDAMMIKGRTFFSFFLCEPSWAFSARPLLYMESGAEYFILDLVLLLKLHPLYSTGGQVWVLALIRIPLNLIRFTTVGSICKNLFYIKLLQIFLIYSISLNFCILQFVFGKDALVTWSS